MFNRNASMGALALVLAGPAWAADTSVTPQAAAPDIIVTAQHRNESLQKIPLAVTVLSADLLARENIDKASQLQNLVPGLKILEIGVQPSIFIRGEGSAVASVLNDPAATYNLDGVSVSRPIAINGLFFDLARAEVLKGPQGTLYGGNSTVGAINIVSNKPEFKFGGLVGVTLGNYNAVKTEGVINVPLSDTFAVRASFQTNKHDGYIQNGGRNSDDADDTGIRVKAYYKPSSDFDALLTGTYFHSGGVGVGDVPLDSVTGAFLDPAHPYHLGIGPTLNNAFAPDPSGDTGTTVPDDGFQNLKTVTLGGQVNVKTPVGTLTLIPSYIKTTFVAHAYDGGFEKNYHTSDRELSFEARLASNPDSASALKWQFGGIIQDVHQLNDVIQLTNPFAGFYEHDNFDLSTKSWALFGQATFSIASSFRVTGGLRYSNFHKTVNGPTELLGVGTNTATAFATFSNVGDATWNNFDYRAGFDYDISPTSLFYGNISSGYKVGGINQGISLPASPNTYSPEHLTAYQLGSKNSFFNRKLQVNVEAWYWSYRDFQEQQFTRINIPAALIPVYSPPGVPFAYGFGTSNAKRSKNYGVETQINWRVTHNDRLSLNVQYDIAKFVDFTQTLEFPGPGTFSFNGHRGTFAPTWSGNIMFEHIFELGSAGTLVASVNNQFTGKTIISDPGDAVPGTGTPPSPPAITRGVTNVTDLQLTYHAPNDRYEIGGYIENLENEPIILFAGNTPAGLWGHARAPRTFGVRASAKF